ncbi:MAG TPA: thiamine phosphate synthase [Candidatus Sulfobium mesophilum]|nr:thiamine phosphate synthase [Candidatus Sulfobium mesophilum]
MSYTKIDFRLYLITDRKLLGTDETLPATVEEALKGGVKAVQLREKDVGTRELLNMAYMLRDVTNRNQARLFINGRVDIALAVGADGVHLGVTDIPVHAARRAAGGRMLIGASAHSVDEAKRAEDEGADFVTLGPVYETPSKMRYGKPVGLKTIMAAGEEVSIPVFAIGGIGHERVAEVLRAGAYGIALISAILASEDIKSSTEEFMRLLK